MTTPGKLGPKQAAKPAAKPKLDVGALLKKSAQAQPASSGKKSEKPVYNIEDLHESIAQFLEAYKNKSDAEAQQAAAEALILPQAEMERLKFCQDNGKLESTVKFQSPAGDIMISASNAYSKIDPAKEESLRALYGDLFDTYFSLKSEVELSEAALKDENIIGKLVEAVGQENFDRYFKVKQYIAVNKNYHEARSTSTELQTKHEEAAENDLVKCNKSSVKPA
jgi:hypothetical protein